MAQGSRPDSSHGLGGKLFYDLMGRLGTHVSLQSEREERVVWTEGVMNSLVAFGW